MAMCLCFFFIFSLSFSIHTQARDTHFFSKFSHQQSTKYPKKVETPAQSPKPAVVEHGYGLYGGENTRYPPMTVDPVKTGYGNRKPFVSMEELRNEMSDTRFLENGNGGVKGTHVGDGNGNGDENEYVTERQGMSDTRYLENGKYYYDVNRDIVKDENRYEGNKGYVTEKQGMSTHVVDENSYPEYPRNGNMAERQGMSGTRFPENDQYYNDVKDENTYNENGYVTEKQGMSTHVQDEKSYPGKRRNGNKNEYVTERQGMSDTRFLENGKYYYDVNQDENTYTRNGYVADEKSYPENHQGNGNMNEYVTERQGMSDTGLSENGKSYYDVNRDFKDASMYKKNGFVSEKQGMSTQVVDENSYPENQKNGNKNGYVTERQGMSDTRFLENGRYHYDVTKDVKNENSNPDNQYFESAENDEFDNNEEYEKGYNENEHYGGNNNGYMKHERRGYNYNGNENTKKLPPNQYDTMEEYDREEEYRLRQQYKP